MATREDRVPVAARRSPFENLTLNDLMAKVANAKGVEAEWISNELFGNGDHWQDGAGWVGPPEKSNPAYKLALERISPQFTPRDVINEVLDRVVNGVAKQEASIGTAPLGVFADDAAQVAARKKQEARSRQLTAALSSWWDTRQFHDKLREAIRYSRLQGRGYLRLWVPLSELEEIPANELGGLRPGSRRVPRGKFEETLGRIHLSAPNPGACAIIVDDETQERASVFLFKRDNKDFAEIAWVERRPDGTRGDTVVRVVGQGDARNLNAEEYRWSIGGRLPVMEMKAGKLITEAVRRQQRRLNFFETSLNRNVETAGFPERYLTNAEPSGILVRRASGAEPGPYPTRIIDGVVYEIHPVPRVLGAGVTTEVQGVKITEREGNRTKESITTPGVHRFEPVDPQGTIHASRHAYQILLEEVNQAHILIAGDATASGVSRQQAEGDFLSDLSDTKGKAEALIRDTLAGAVAMAEYFGGATESSVLKDMRITATLTLTPGAPSPDQQRVAKELRTDGDLPLEEFLSRIGVEDVDAMIERLEQDDSFLLARLKKRAEAMDLLMTAGWTFEGAAAAVGFTEEEIRKAREGTKLPAGPGAVPGSPEDTETEEEDEDGQA
jgi:hypothetical protein